MHVSLVVPVLCVSEGVQVSLVVPVLCVSAGVCAGVTGCTCAVCECGCVCMCHWLYLCCM